MLSEGDFQTAASISGGVQFTRHKFCVLQAIQEDQQVIIGSVTSGPTTVRYGFRENLFLQRQTSGEVDLCGFDGLVSKPQRDHGRVDAGLQ